MQSFNLATPFEPLRVRATTTQQLERYCDKRNGARSHGDCQWRVIARIGELLSARLGRSLLSGVFRTIAPCLIGCGVSRTTWFCRIPRIRLVGIGRPGLIRVRVAGLRLLLHRQRTELNRDIKVRVGDRRLDLVLARRGTLVGDAGVLDLHARGIDRPLKARGKRWVRLSLEALGVVNLHRY